MTRYWLAVASRDHVHIGRTGGFMQVCHGREAPLRRVRPGDWVVYYSPREQFGGSTPLRTVTALGRVREGGPYPFDMGNGFVPFRRDVDWQPAREVPLAPLLDDLDLSRGKRNWAFVLRFGLVELSAHDMRRIAQAMDVQCAA